MENQPNPSYTMGRRWFRLGSVAQLNTPGQGSTQAQPTPAPAQRLGQGPSEAQTTPAPAQDPAPSLSQPAQTIVPAPPQPHPPPPPSPPLAQRAQANKIANGAQASQQPTPPSPRPRMSSQPPARPPESPKPRISTRPPTPQPTESTNPRMSSRPPTPQPPESPKPRIQSRPPTPPPPESPKVIKTLTPTESPTHRQLKPIYAPLLYLEPEPKPEPTTNHNPNFMQPGNSNASVIADINGKQLENSNQSHIDARVPPPLPSPRRETTKGEKKFIMAEENTGAYMELVSPNGQHINCKQPHGHFLQHQNKDVEPESDGDQSKDKKKDKEKKSITEGKPMIALVNSNVQSVNNSIIFKSSCTQQSPGVHETIISRRQPKHKGTTHQ